MGRIPQVYATEDVLDTSASVHCPRLEMASRSKLSCVCWNSYIKHLLLAADYDGCLSLWDAQSNVCTGNFDVHGKRVWSADFSMVSILRPAVGTTRYKGMPQMAVHARGFPTGIVRMRGAPLP